MGTDAICCQILKEFETNVSVPENEGEILNGRM